MESSFSPVKIPQNTPKNPQNGHPTLLNTCINWCSQESGLFRTPEKLVLLNRGFFWKKLLKKSARVLLVFLTLLGGSKIPQKYPFFTPFSGIIGSFYNPKLQFRVL